MTTKKPAWRPIGGPTDEEKKKGWLAMDRADYARGIEVLLTDDRIAPQMRKRIAKVAATATADLSKHRRGGATGRKVGRVERVREDIRRIQRENKGLALKQYYALRDATIHPGMAEATFNDHARKIVGKPAKK